MDEFISIILILIKLKFAAEQTFFFVNYYS